MPFFKNINTVKVIVLGTYPSVDDHRKFEKVFGLENENTHIVNFIKSDFRELGLSLNEAYIQNLCRNYFIRETATVKIGEYSRGGSTRGD